MASSTGAQGWLRAAVFAGVWGGAVAAGLVVARLTKVGPILFEISGRHGVHAGDVVAFALAFAAAVVCTTAWPHSQGRRGASAEDEGASLTRS